MRKALLFCLAAAASVGLASPVLARSDRTQSGQSTSSASSTSSATTVTGTVVSSSDNQLVIDTPTGRQMFTVVSGTSDIPAGLTAGTQVTVQFTSSGDQRTVSRVTTGSSSSPGTYNSGTSSQYGSAGTSTDRGNDVTRGTRTDRDDKRRAGATDNDRDNNNLPATASPAFLVGLLGLLSLGGSALLRALRRLL